jgi:hypothetical protein
MSSGSFRILTYRDLPISTAYCPRGDASKRKAPLKEAGLTNPTFFGGTGKGADRPKGRGELAEQRPPAELTGRPGGTPAAGAYQDPPAPALPVRPPSQESST